MSIESLTWFKSSYSSGEGGECLEVAAHPTAIHIRDSKQPAAPHLTLTPSAWSAFLLGEKERLAR
ncbi:DUF397 domain-containing protein [Streptomyces sp. NPDC001851]|uniref:DUF397 domain-containing protein n=1 Tax=Streptomyces sp. NPDC001851 TaxID=3154529 RepID=UPI003331B17B